ncbi:MAG TPA: hypothetical protein ENJ82_08970 [Bacteroidetes bacterium]|nr:hypothetical protein [Bacteroidota bacterium]
MEVAYKLLRLHWMRSILHFWQFQSEITDKVAQKGDFVGYWEAKISLFHLQWEEVLLPREGWEGRR